MANNLYPEGYENETIEASDTTSSDPIGYRPGVAFDQDTGDFIRDGKNRIVDASGVASWKEWCINCIQTQRYMHLAYSSDFGIDLNKVFSASSHDEAESVLTREITEAILADPYGRTAYISNLDFDWTAPDSVQINATFVGIDDVTIDITAYIEKGESS